MREVVLDGVELCTETLPRERPLQERWNGRAAAAVGQPMEHERRAQAMAEDITDLAQQIEAAVLVERDVVHIGQLDARLAQAIGDRLCGKAGPMLDTAKALLL